MEAWQADLQTAHRSVISFPATSFTPVIPEHLLKNLTPALEKQFFPSLEENVDSGLKDPIGDQIKSPANGIVHRYHNRLLFFPTTSCPVHCRYCFRRNELSERKDVLKGKIDSLTSYLYDHPEIEEVILSGGDPLTLTDQKLEQIFTSLKAVKTVKFVRLHSRTPTALPSRVTPQLCQLLERSKKYFLSFKLILHINCEEEFTPENILALKQLPLELLSQSVLLRGVNDNIETLEKLFRKLIELNIRPYYLHHPDRVQGGMHFYLDHQTGRALMQKLRQRLPGWALPQYIVDSPDGVGKRPV